MNYYNPGRRSLISDIMSPVSDDGYNVEHQKIQKQPIGSLDKRYQRRYAYTQAAPNRSQGDPAQGDSVRHFTMVPPLTTLRQEEEPENKFGKLHGTLAATGLAALAAWRNFREWVGGVIAFIKPQSNAFRYAALPVLLAVFGILWLLHTDTPIASGGSHSIPNVGQLIPMSNSSKSGSNNSKNGASSQNPSAAGSASPQDLQSASTIPGSYASASGGSGGTSGVIGGRGGVGGGTTTPTTSSGSGTGGVLPLTLTVPPVNTSTPDGKTLLNSSGTTLQVN